MNRVGPPASEEPGRPPGTAASAERPTGAPDRDPETAQRRFSDLLRGETRDRRAPETRPRGRGPAGEEIDALAAAVHSAARSPADASGTARVERTGAAGSDLSDLALKDVSAATGTDGARVCLTIDEGSLAGVRMAFFLRGTTLDVSIATPTAEIAAAVRDREADAREALAGQGIDMGRFDLENDGRDHGNGAPPDDAPVARTAAPLSSHATGGLGRDYTR